MQNPNPDRILRLLKQTAALLVAAVTFSAAASPDWPPAEWVPTCNGHWYTSGNGKRMYVIHDMEGYYESGRAYLQRCDISVSIHYMVNGKADGSGGLPGGECAQNVLDAYYAWHARCWNLYSMGTEHEGFASSPAWFTEPMYQTSSSITRAKCNVYGIAKDRNHIVAHGQKSVAGWPAWASANLGIDPNCNDHTDPGPYWDWAHYMNLVNSGGVVNNASVVGISYPASVAPGQTFTASVTMNNNGTTTWINSGANPYNLGSQNPQDNGRWGTGRVGLPAASVAPGANATFTFTCTAPTSPGTYAFDWKMVQEMVQWFGATATGSIVVTGGDIVVDNNSAGFSASANWITASSSPDKYGADYRYHSTQAVSDQATWTANLPSSGTYKVYAWWPQGANRTANIGYTVYHAGGSTAAYANQQVNGGQWNLLGTFSMNAGNNQVKLSCWAATGFVVMADAIRWQQQ